MSRDRQSTLFLANQPTAPKKEGGDSTAVIVLLYPPGAQIGRRFTLHAADHVVGRAPDLDVPIDSDSVSRRHARFVRTETGWMVEDLGSTNGTFVNDVRLERKLLGDGDLLRFGGAIMKFLSGENIEAAYHEEIYRMSIIDGLTGVHNKRYFLEFMDREIAGAARHQLPLTLVMFDIDHFKQVNDVHGHLAGDAVLKELSARLRPRIRREDLMARYGGEEFACVLTKTDQQGAILFAESLRVMIASKPFPYQEKELPVTISLGVAALDLAHPGPPDELIKRADERLYAAKHAGRNRVVG